MDRLRDADTTLVVPNPNDIPPPGSVHDKPGFFAECDLEGGFLGTPFRAYWANMITECIRNAIVKAGLTPEYTDWTQLGLAIETIATTVSGTVSFVQDGGNVTGTIANGKFTLQAPEAAALPDDLVQDGGNVTGTISLQDGTFTLTAPTAGTPDPDGPSIETGVVAIGTGTGIRAAKDGSSAATWSGQGLGVNDGSVGASGGNGDHCLFGGTRMDGTQPINFRTALQLSIQQPAVPGKFFIECTTDNVALGVGTPRFTVTLGGLVSATSTSIAAADYAEWFETWGGQPIAPGISVVLDGGKVRPATEADDPRDIIGITRPAGAPGVIGNAAEDHWAGLFLKDAFGQPILEETLLTEIDPETEAVTVVPALTPKRNPAYDPTRPYIPRSQRPDWALVGLLGQVPIRVGQPLGDRWRVMGRGAEGVDLIFIR